MKGNVMDLAIGVIIGGAFGKIVTSLVDNIIMPLAGALIGGKNFDSYSASIGGATLKYGMFLSATIDFVIIAFVLFVIIRTLNKAVKKKNDETVQVENNETVKILGEIRDILAQNRSQSI